MASGETAKLSEKGIVVQALGKTYTPPNSASGARGEVKVFADMHFVVKPNERVALIGESGAGKSTLLHLLGGLDRATTGKVFFHATEITSLDADSMADFRNRQIGFVWQNQSLLPEFTAEENVMIPLLIRGESRPLAKKRAAELLERVGLAKRREHRAGELSGGEQQRVALARALAGRPSFLLADEPTGNLDEATAAQIFDLLEELHASYQLTSLIVTHSPALAKRCDRTLRLSRGGIQEVVVKMEPESHV
ncbi:MAG: ABC transporter ATP-binding protein [Bryobacter sp.]|nr:ABC transporter ATP-binding protein [Bryobacter sp.]